MSLNKSSTPRNLIGAAAVVVALGLSSHAFAMGDEATQAAPAEPECHNTIHQTVDSPATPSNAVNPESMPAIDHDTDAVELAAWWDWLVPRWRA